MKHFTMLLTSACLLGALHAQTQTAEGAAHDLLTATKKIAQPTDAHTPAFYSPKGVA